MHDSALDFVTFIIVLGIVVAISLNLVIPIVKDSQQLVYQEQYDKTIEKIQGDMAEPQTDGSYSIEETVLQIMGQSYFMPEPRIISIAGTEIEVRENVGFTPLSKPIGNNAYLAIENWAKAFVEEFGDNDLTKFNNKIFNKGLKAESLPGIKDMRFRIKFDYGDLDETSGGKPADTDDTYALYVIIDCIDLDTGIVEPQEFKCLSGGDIK